MVQQVYLWIYTLRRNEDKDVKLRLETINRNKQVSMNRFMDNQNLLYRYRALA